jgi:hypothetical protein
MLTYLFAIGILIWALVYLQGTAVTGLNVGVNEHLYNNTGTYGSPTWVLVTTVQDVTIGLDKSMAEVKSRLSTWVMNLPGLKTATLEFGLLGDTSITFWDTLKAAYINDTLMDFAVSDYPIANTGAEYFRSQWYINGFPIDQKLEDAQTAKVTCACAYSATNVPNFVSVP